MTLTWYRQTTGTRFIYICVYCLHLSIKIVNKYIYEMSACGGGNPEKTTDQSQVTDKLYHIMLYWVHLTWVGFELTLVVICTDCIGSCKSNYHTITAPIFLYSRFHFELFVIQDITLYLPYIVLYHDNHLTSVTTIYLRYC
jgi:hypothetical protein